MYCSNFADFIAFMENKTNETKTLLKIQSKFLKVIKDYRLIENDDNILIGLSGGKDSLALVELLGERMKVFVPRFTLTAVHISVENIPYQTDLDYLKTYCEQFGVKFVHHITKFDETTDNNKSKCFLCSWYRRKALFEVAKELKCNKIALGHHLDDIAETLLMNLVFQGSFGSMPPLLKMEKFDISLIRPLALITEKQMIEFESIRQLKKQIKNCPYEKLSSRKDAKKLLLELEKWNPNVRQSLWKATENVKSDYLPLKKRL